MSMSMLNSTAAPRFERLHGNSDGAQRIDRREARGDDDSERRRSDNDGPGRRSPLVGALMQALRALMAEPAPAAGPTATTTSASATSAPAAAPAVATGSPAAAGVDVAAPLAATGGTTLGATPAATTTGVPTGAGDLEEAAYAFANELFAALRSDGRDGDRGLHRGHHRHHHGHHGKHDHEGTRSRSAYSQFGGLVQRLQGLANALQTPAAASTTPPIDAARAVAAAGEPTVPTAPVPSPEPPVPAAAVAAGGSLNISIDIKLSVSLGAQAASPAAEPAAGSALLKAFEQLMQKLDPAAAGAADPSATGTSADRLKAFLLGMAEALKHSGTADAGLRPGVGSLIDVAA